MLDVVAAFIQNDNKFLICQRSPQKSRGLLWEFVGGKVENNESLSDALIRECQEELTVTVSIDQKIADVVHRYPDVTIHLVLFQCHITNGSLTLLEHQDAKWVSLEEIDNYPLCPADEELIQIIRDANIIS